MLTSTTSDVSFYHMIVRATSVNPNVLRWARERSGLSVEKVAETLGRAPGVIAAWEDGAEVPTFRQLEALASRIYKRPIAMFFFPAPPDEKEVAHEFRTLPSAELSHLDADTLFAIREARAWQLSLAELMVGYPDPKRRLTSAIRPSPADSPEAVSGHLRTFLGVTVREQQSWRTPEHALKEWRRVVEECGVYVFKRAFQQKDISGFCLHDDLYPVVVINNSTSFTRQIFTLFHEVAHLIYGFSGVTTRDQAYIASLRGTKRQVEIACNRVASDFLLPHDAFPVELLRFPEADLGQVVETTAKLFNVSREVVLRRLLDSGLISNRVYSEKVSEWALDYFRGGGGEGGGSYYANQGSYFSPTFLDAAFYQLRSGRLSIGDLADHLGMKAKSISRFEDYLLRRS